MIREQNNCPFRTQDLFRRLSISPILPLMKWTTAQAQSHLKKDAATWPSVIVAYGDDGGQARTLIQNFIEASGTPSDDPFLFSAIDLDDLAAEPHKLLEAAQTIGFGGGLRVIHLKGITAEIGAANQRALTEAIKACLSADLQDVLIVAAAPGLDAKVALVKTLEKASNGAAIRCFMANAGDIRAQIQAVFQPLGQTVATDAMAWLCENLGADAAITKNELEKLAIYTHGQSEIILEDCLSVVAGAPTGTVFQLCDAVGQRNTAQVDALLSKLLAEGEDVNMVFALVIRHLRRIAEAQEHVAAGTPPSEAIKRLAPPVFFGQPAFIAQVNTYPHKRAANVAARALDAQADARGGILPEELVLTRAILSFAA